MLANARDRFFWPGLDAAVQQLRLQCRKCNEIAPSQSAEPLIITPPPEYPFQHAVVDLCHLEGHSFMVYADRYSGWVEVERLPSTTLINCRKVFLRWFATYGVPEEISSDGGPPFNAAGYDEFCKNWGIRKRLSSAHYPQSNGRAEAAVKSAKRILTGNINPVSGALDTDSAARALMAHRNTPAQDTGVSPSVLLFGRPLRDHLPRSTRELRPEWGMISKSREHALAKRVCVKASGENRTEHKPLVMGDDVQIQNQYGNRPNRWYNTGVVAEVLPDRQYRVVVDGSRRLTLRNRKFLKKIHPIHRKSQDVPLERERPDSVGSDEPRADNDVPHREPPEQVGGGESNVSDQVEPTNDDTSRSDDTTPTVPTPEPGLRRSSRVRKQRSVFSAKMTGKYHE